MGLFKEQKVFRDIEADIIEGSEKTINTLTKETRQELFDISSEYNNAYGGDIMPPSSIKRLQSSLNAQTNTLLGGVGITIDGAMDENMDNIFLGNTYSYSKASDSYLNYKTLTPKQKAVTKFDRIDGKTYLERLSFHSKNLNKRTSAIIQNGIRLGMSNQQIAKNISKEMGINYRHSLTISRTETGRVGSIAAENAANNAIEQGLVFIKTWRQYASKDPRHDHSQMDGATVKAGEEFQLPSGSTCQYPRLTGFAGDDINCHCEAIESFEGFETDERRQGRDIVKIPDYDVWKKSKKGIIKPIPPKSIAPKSTKTKIKTPKPSVPTVKKWVVLDKNDLVKSFDTKKEAHDFGIKERKKGKMVFVMSKIDANEFRPKNKTKFD